MKERTTILLIGAFGAWWVLRELFRKGESAAEQVGEAIGEAHGEAVDLVVDLFPSDRTEEAEQELPCNRPGHSGGLRWPAGYNPGYTEIIQACENYDCGPECVNAAALQNPFGAPEYPASWTPAPDPIYEAQKGPDFHALTEAKRKYASAASVLSQNALRVRSGLDDGFFQTGQAR